MKFWYVFLVDADPGLAQALAGFVGIVHVRCQLRCACLKHLRSFGIQNQTTPKRQHLGKFVRTELERRSRQAEHAFDAPTEGMHEPVPALRVVLPVVDFIDDDERERAVDALTQRCARKLAQIGPETGSPFQATRYTVETLLEPLDHFAIGMLQPAQGGANL
jgi:hypothetical protein